MFPNNPSDWRPVEAQATPTPPAVSIPPAKKSSPGYARVATLLAVAVFGGLIGFAADRWVTTNPATPASAPVVAAAPTIGSVPRVGARAAQNGGAPASPTPQSAPAASATDPAQAAIQLVIQRGDDEQAQALASNDPKVMADTSTPDFYQQQVQINQDLVSNGVSVIKLINIEWGPITVSGTNATATAWETWTTTYSDGTTEQSRDRNVYTLVLDNGAWKVSADAHPDDVTASAGGQPTTPARPAQPAQPAQPARPRGQRGQSSNTSQNWSGYTATGGTYTAVSGTWTVPQFSASSTAGADAAWVGIGGVSSRDLIQAGTQQTVSGSGSTHYEAWVETLPQASHPVPLTVHAGDSVSVAITQVPRAQDQWQISFVNNTTGQTFQVTEHYTSSMSSAEWIEEAPSAARGRQMPLDNFGRIDFSAASAVKDGQQVTAAAAGANAITMIDRTGQSLATPTGLGTDGASFTVSRG